MAKRRRAIDIWKQMQPASLRRLALAVFLMFGALGPITVLMESALHAVTWKFVITQSVSLGGFAASIVLFGRKRWWVTSAVVIFWMAVIALDAGGLSLQFGNEGVRARLGTAIGVQDRSKSAQDVIITNDQLDVIYTQRATLGTVSIILITCGYIMFIRVVRREVSERARLETEVTIARDIQQSLLPPIMFETEWVKIAGKSIPASEVGGDFFDVIAVSDSRMAVAVADVTGHGVGAGILSAMTKSALHSQILNDPSPPALLSNMNSTIFALSQEKMFVTFAYLLLDRSNNRIGFATAGHPPILIRRGRTGMVESLRLSNIGLGIRKEYSFTGSETELGLGDTVLLYTDGVLEAMDKKDEQFGSQRLTSAFQTAPSDPVAICDDIYRSLCTFGETGTFHDDITLLALTLV